MAKADDLKKQYDQGLQIGLLMSAGMIVFLIILNMLGRIPIKNAHNRSSIVFMFLLTATLALPFIVFLKKELFKNDWAQLEAQKSNPDRIKHITMVFAAQAATPILVGTIAYLITKNFMTFIPFIVLTGISFVFCFPKWTEFENWLKSQKVI